MHKNKESYDFSMNVIIINQHHLCLQTTRTIIIRILDELQNYWLSTTNEGCIYDSHFNFECLTNGKEQYDDINNDNDDYNDVEHNNIGDYNNNRSMLSKEIDRSYQKKPSSKMTTIKMVQMKSYEECKEEDFHNKNLLHQECNIAIMFNMTRT